MKDETPGLVQEHMSICGDKPFENIVARYGSLPEYEDVFAGEIMALLAPFTATMPTLVMDVLLEDYLPNITKIPILVATYAISTASFIIPQIKWSRRIKRRENRLEEISNLVDKPLAREIYENSPRSLTKLDSLLKVREKSESMLQKFLIHAQEVKRRNQLYPLTEEEFVNSCSAIRKARENMWDVPYYDEYKKATSRELFPTSKEVFGEGNFPEMLSYLYGFDDLN